MEKEFDIYVEVLEVIQKKASGKKIPRKEVKSLMHRFRLDSRMMKCIMEELEKREMINANQHYVIFKEYEMQQL